MGAGVLTCNLSLPLNLCPHLFLCDSNLVGRWRLLLLLFVRYVAGRRVLREQQADGVGIIPGLVDRVRILDRS